MLTNLILYSSTMQKLEQWIKVLEEQAGPTVDNKT